MASAIRQLDPEAIYHVVSRGNNGGSIVLDAVDRSLFRQRMDKVAREYEWEIFSWCLMTTHVHYVMRAPEGGISDGMQALHSRHAVGVNRRYGRTGHLFQNRFFSVEIETDAHLVSSLVYVNRNPLAAFAVEAAEDWRDSSYLGLASVPGWLAADFVLGLFGRAPSVARRALAELVSSGRVPSSEALDDVRRYETRGIVPELAATSG